MEDPGELPSVLRATPQPLVGFVGLGPDDESQRRRLWETFTSNRGLDRHPLTFHPINLETAELPVAKPARQTYEWLVPRGILKRNWMKKHLNVLPSVVVVFADIDWTDPDMRAVVSTVARVRQLLAGRLTKVVVVLLQTDTSTPTDSVMTALCAQCGLSSRAIFPLRVGEGEEVAGRVVQLETAVQELAQNYYHAQIKVVRGHREQLNRTSHLQLLVRHGFKLGFLNELKSDHHAAYKSYTAAYQLLLDMRVTEHSASEVCTVAGFLSYKICRLAFRLNLPRDAIAQFRKHMDQFKASSGPAQLSWEHAAWQAGQAAAFGQLFSEAVRAGQSAVQTQHPGLYFQLGAEYAISRRKLADSLCSAVSSYPAPDPLAVTPQSIEFYGQRPWRPGKQEPPDLAKEKEGIEALQYRERTRTKHSQIILNLLRLATEQFEKFKSPRMKSRLTLQMAEEEMAEGEYSAALDTLLPCLPAYRAEMWPSLLVTLLASALKCAFLCCRLGPYSAISLELCKLEAAEEGRVWGNLMLVLLSGKPPLPEPSLTGKSERASVANATKGWIKLLEGDQEAVEEVDLTGFASCLDITLTLPETATVGEELLVRLMVSNYSSAVDLGVMLGRVTICFKAGQEDYSKQCTRVEGVEVQGGQVHDVVFTTTAMAGDAGGTLEVSRVEVEVGSACKVLLVMRPPHRPETAEQPLEWKKVGSVQRWSCQVGPRESLASLEVVHHPPVLVGEWFPLLLSLENLEVESVTSLTMSAWLRDAADPLVTDTTLLTLEPEHPAATPLSPTEGGPGKIEQVVGKMAAGEKAQVTFYLRASTVGPRALVVQLCHKVGGLPAMLTRTLELPVVDAFSLASTFLTNQLEETSQANTDEMFCLSLSLSSSSPHPLEIVSTCLETRPPLSSSMPPTNNISGMALSGLCTVEQLFPLLVPSSGLLPQLDTQTLHTGKFVLSWKRTEAVQQVVNKTEFDLPTVKLVRSLLYAECSLPSSATLRTPLQAVFTLHNRTNDLQEYTLATEPSEAFMFSGPKQVRIKLFPRASYTLGHIFYPLICGSAPLPRLRVSAAEGVGSGAQEAL